MRQVFNLFESMRSQRRSILSASVLILAISSVSLISRYVSKKAHAQSILLALPKELTQHTQKG